jgi:threonine/homoserine/homoserine lactone efflux protein
MTNDVGLRIIAGVCLVFGVIFALWGERTLPKRGPLSSRFSGLPKPSTMRWFKWVMGGALVYVGLAILFHP